MRKILLLSVLFTISILSQNFDMDYFKHNPELYFSFSINDKSELTQLTNIISIDNITQNNLVFAYANENEFIEFMKIGYDFTPLTHPGKMIVPDMSSDLQSILTWNVYPTYDAYINMMYQFQAFYPNICQIVDAGNTVQGRKILFAKISDNVSQREAEPQFMYTSSMHGDETTGYVLMLRLIDSLLTSYGTNSRITNLVDNAEIWINPLANPDGTYHGGNNTVSGATRYNVNGYDLNRNFPDPVYGVNSNQQIETTRFRNIQEANNFALIANFHGGTEVVNYPWDTWSNIGSGSRTHPDEPWYQYISHLYADTCQAFSPSNYMNGFDDGTTNGGAWYIVHGGRQDYTNYFRWGREVTIEISDTKLLPASQLPAHWEYNKRSFLNYMESIFYGISGIVMDTVGNTLKAKITILNHDIDNSEVWTDSATGYYTRMIAPGIYNLKFEAEDHFDLIVNGVAINNYNSTVNLNVELIPVNPIPVELESFSASINPNGILLKWITASETNNLGFEIERKKNSKFEIVAFVNGKGTSTEKNYYSFLDDKVTAGNYEYRLKQIDFNGEISYSDILEIDYNTPSAFNLEQNYPNPFNPNTVISFSLQESGNVKLFVSNILGETVSNIYIGRLEAGNHNFNFDGTNLSSGIFVYTLEFEGKRISKSMILLK